MFRHGNPFGINTNNGFTANNTTCDEQNEAIGMVFCMPVDDTITHVVFRNGTKTGTPADDSYTVAVQSVTDGLPAGILGGGSPASQTFPNATYPVAGFGSGTGHSIQLANSIALQGGSIYAVTIQKTGATDASHFLALTNSWNEYDRATIPYVVICNAAGTWSKAALTGLTIGLRSATRDYYPSVLSFAQQDAGGTAEIAAMVTAPSAFGDNTFGLRGVRIIGGDIEGGGTITLNLYGDPTGSNPSILQTTGQIDSDNVRETATSLLELFWPEDTLSALDAGTTYAIGLSASQSSGWAMMTAALIDATNKTALPEGGFTYASRTLASAYPPDASDGAFSETAATVCFIEPIWGTVTPPSGGSGGMLVHPGMNGGLRG